MESSSFYNNNIFIIIFINKTFAPLVLLFWKILKQKNFFFQLPSIVTILSHLLTWSIDSLSLNSTLLYSQHIRSGVSSIKYLFEIAGNKSRVVANDC